MLLDVIFDSLRFLDRDDLDACQLASKSIQGLIQDSSTLALRSIEEVTVGYKRDRPYMDICDRKKDGTQVNVEPWQDVTLAGDVSSLDRLRNAYIKRMTLLAEAERCVPLLSGVSASLNFTVGRLHYDVHLQETETLQRSVEWIVRDLRVTDYELFFWEDQTGFGDLLPTTLTHESVRATAEYLSMNVCTRSQPAVFFERLFDMLFDAAKSAAVLRFYEGGGGTQFSEELIRRFVVANDVSRVARSISVMQGFKRDHPHNYLPQICVTPRKQGVDAPKTRLYEGWPPSNSLLFGARYDVRKGDLYVFNNDASGRELHLFATTAHSLPGVGGNDLFVMTLTIA